ncbi:hypothetical protein TNCV_1955971 [Trichonephila clavipes]|nr:hypothetical protein TNCV_1955971 [Trichonephila clavipes]
MLERMNGQWQFQRHDGSRRPRTTADREDRFIVRSVTTVPGSSLSTIRRATHTQQDNAKPQTTSVAMSCLTAYQAFPWPAILTDASPIEHVWDMIGRRMHLPGNVDDLA